MQSLSSDRSPEKAQAPPTPIMPPSYGLMLPVSLAMGIGFGFALEKGRVFEPAVILDQMLFHRFQMLKMFLSAVATSVTVMTALRAIPGFARYVEHTRKHFFTAPQNLHSVVLGAGLLGVGMALGGSCPGSAIIQLGAGVRQGIFVVLGGLLAGGLYSYFQPILRPWITSNCPAPQNRTVDKMFKTSYTMMALPLAIALTAIVAGLEYYRPWYHDVGYSNVDEILPPHLSLASILAMKAWPPQIAGICVGLLQIPAIALLAVTLGSASSFATVAVNVLHCACPSIVNSSQYMTSLRSAWWQPIYLLGAFLGAYLSSNLSRSWGSVASFSPLTAFLAGFFLIGGARLAGGCTSGHGISGFAHLATVSFVAVPSMFGGAIATAFALNALRFGL